MFVSVSKMGNMESPNWRKGVNAYNSLIHLYKDNDAKEGLPIPKIPQTICSWMISAGADKGAEEQGHIRELASSTKSTQTWDRIR